MPMPTLRLLPMLMPTLTLMPMRSSPVGCAALSQYVDHFLDVRGPCAVVAGTGDA
jgi:hypothetical protein